MRVRLTKKGVLSLAKEKFDWLFLEREMEEDIQLEITARQDSGNIGRITPKSFSSTVAW